LKLFPGKHQPKPNAIAFLKYVGPGLLVTVGFIDPGNWASNIVAGSQYGYVLLWMVTLSTIMLIGLQHNAAHLGIVTGKCLSEAATENMKPWVRSIVLGRRQYLCRYFYRTVRYLGLSYESRSPHHHGSGNIDHFSHYLAIRRPHLFPDVAERAASNNHLHIDLSNLIKKSNG
jgi:hypothetical protein